MATEYTKQPLGVDLAQGAIDRPPIVFVSPTKRVSVFVSFFVFHLLCDLALSAVGKLGLALGAVDAAFS